MTPAVDAVASLDRSLVRGIAWTGGVRWAGQGLTWASTIVVARALTPEDYGIVGMAAVFLGLVTMLSEFGLGSAVVTLRALDQRQVMQLNTLSVAFGVLSFAVACAAAVPLSRFFHTPELTPVLIVLGAGCVVAGFRTIPDAVLQKELEFRTLALMEGAQSMVVALATVAFALAGMRYWTLVMGTLLGGILSTTLAVARRPHGFAWPRSESIRQALTFSWRILVARLSWYVYSSADFLVVGRVLGQAALGTYNFSWSLASIPIGKVSGMIVRVTPAYFAAVQEQRTALRRYFLTLTEGLALVTFPATIGLALVADDFVLLVLGEKWQPAIPVLRLLAFYASFRSITPLLPQVLAVTGDTRFSMWNSIVAALALPIAFVAGARWGVVGVATAWMIAHPLLILPLFVRVLHRLEMGFGTYLRALWPALSGCALMAMAAGAAQAAAQPTLPLGAVLALQVAGGGGAYALVVALLHRERLQVFRNALRT